MNILITGVNGFVGKHLVRELTNRGNQVIGVGRDESAHPEIADAIKYLVCDLTSPAEVKQLPLDDVKAVISLAGLASVGDSFTKADFYQRINVEVLKVPAEELVRRGLKIRIIAVSTGAVYDAQQPMPLNEESKLITAGAGSPYAQSKIAMEKTANQLRQHGLDCIIARPFNHIGPGQAAGFLLPDLYEKIKSSLDSGSPVRVGNLNTRRDYTDVRDVVKAYADLVLAPTLKHNLYNICTGKSASGREILDLLSISMETGQVAIEQDPGLMRPNDPPEIYGSYGRIKSEVGWQPTYPLEKTIADFVTAQS